MNGMSKNFSIYLVIGLAVFGFAAQTNAQTTRTTRTTRTTQTTRNERNVRDNLRSLNSKVDDFKYSLDNELAKNAISRDEENQINGDVQDFEDSLKQFGDKLDRRRENSDDVRSVLTAAQPVNDFLSAKSFGALPQKDWSEIRTLLNALASNYQVSWNWNGGGDNDRNSPNNASGYPNDNYPATTAPRSNSNFSNSLTGTYQLDTTRSENARDIAERAVRNGGTANNQNLPTDLEDKLQAPEQVVIEVRGNQVTLASSNAAQLTFAADGRDRTENTADGKTIRLRSTLRGQELTVSSIGGETDYTLVFTPIENGRALKVTRRITTDYLRETVFRRKHLQ